MELGYTLKVEQAQKMTMNPEILQSIEILQYTGQELTDYLNEKMIENPFLELEERDNSDMVVSSDSIREKYLDSEENSTKQDLNERLSHGEYSEYQGKPRISNNEDNKESFDNYTAKRENLWDNLKSQLQLCKLDDIGMKVGYYLIDEIDENGYLNTDMDYISQCFGIETSQVEDILFLIQGFEPTGVGARNLAECLIIQICEKGLMKSEMIVLLDKYLEEMAQNNVAKIVKETDISKEIVNETISIIKKLEPKPGRAYYTENDARYIVPDVRVKDTEGNLDVDVLDSSIPKVSISTYYKDLTKDAANDKNVKEYLTGCLNNAGFIMRAIEQRRETIYNVSCTIVKLQQDFFTMGRKYLKPMTLKNVAEELNIHESTVSRAIHGKFMATPYGVLPFKFFFNSGIASDSGDGLSSTSIKLMIKELIDGESTSKPYSDQYISDYLNKKGIDISRRTVAKYREGMGIESSSKRKRY